MTAILVEQKGDERQQFAPAVTIKAGQTITWKNASSEIQRQVRLSVTPSLLPACIAISVP